MAGLKFYLEEASNVVSKGGFIIVRLMTFVFDPDGTIPLSFSNVLGCVHDSLVVDWGCIHQKLEGSLEK